MTRYTTNNSNDYGNTTGPVDNAWKNCSDADDQSQILTWLSPLEPRARHWEVQERRVAGVGEWLIQTEKFRRWWGSGEESGDENPILFCYGDPGAGKTFMSSLVVDRLRDQMGEDTAVTCFYFEFAGRKEQSATHMLASLLKQMVGKTGRIPEEIWRIFRGLKGALNGGRLRLVDVVQMLRLITSSQRTFMCIDGLDECSAVQRFRLFDSLKEILEGSPATRIFVTGRPHVRAEIGTRLAGLVVSVSISPTKDDITRYLRVRLGEDETPDAVDESLEADIMEKILENISELFILVSLNIDAILRESTMHRRQERLGKITDGLGLGGAYDATIKRIKSQEGDKSRLGMEALMWICHAERPLRADELCHALAIKLGSSDFNADNVPSMQTLVSYCQGLITVDKEASTVQPVHITLHRYLSSNPEIFLVGEPHSAIAEICLTYLNSQQVKDLAAAPSLDTCRTPFLEYCSVYWGVHARIGLSARAKSLALELLQGYDGHVSAGLLLKQVNNLELSSFGPNSRLSGLHCASGFGIVELVAALIKMGSCDINERDFRGSTPLLWAARSGHEEVVKYLLAQEGVSPNMSNNYGQTPLSYATQCGHEGVIKMLLLWQEEVSPDEPDNCGQTLLSCPIQNELEGMGDVLHGDEEVNPDIPDNGIQTALSRAAQYGNERLVKSLLEREEVNPDKPDNDGRTPLSYAAQNRREGVVNMLLRRKEVNPDKPDNRGLTPLLYAAWYGFERVVKILLEREEVNLDKPDSDNQTPLSYAAWHGHEGVVEILLERKEVSPDKPDNSGRTPLSYAARSGYERVVKILLGREEVNPDKPDNRGKTPLSYAAQNRREGVVKILLGQEEVNPDKPDNDGRTPLSYAAQNGCESVMKILLELKVVNPGKPDNGGLTPLSYAALCGREGAVKILLEREVNPKKLDNLGRTPAMIASRHGHEKVAALLRSYKAVARKAPKAI